VAVFQSNRRTIGRAAGSGFHHQRRSPGSIQQPDLRSAAGHRCAQGPAQLQRGLNDEAYERIPAQLRPRLRPDSFGSIAPDADGWQLRFTGGEGFTYAVETSTNLAGWQPIATNQASNGVFEMELPATAERSFFRSVLLP
jgi:hypothetical protein